MRTEIEVHWSYAEIHAAALATTHQEYTVPLVAGDTADLPGTSKKVAAGPGTVTYRAYRDGGMDVIEITASVVGRR